MVKKLTAVQLRNHNLINNQEFLVLQFLRRDKGSISNRKLAIWLDLPINCVTARVYALRQKNLVIQTGYEFDKETRKTVRVWASN